MEEKVQIVSTQFITQTERIPVPGVTGPTIEQVIIFDDEGRIKDVTYRPPTEKTA